jgi:4-amino-4-deoxy-L-arabinose transferase-like glycosyltransferase
MEDQIASTKSAPVTKSLIWAMVAVFATAFCVRIVFVALRGVKVAPDTADYTRLAENIRAHGAFSLEAGPEFTPSIRRAPLYPVFLAGFVHSGNVSQSAVAVTQIILDAGIAAVIVLLVTSLATVRWALIAGAVYALHPGAIYFSTAIITEPLFTPLSVASTVLLIYGLRSNRAVLTTLAGAAFGLATLCRPVVFLLPFLLLAIWLLFSTQRPRKWLHTSLTIVCMTLVLAPWLIRCARVSGHFVFVQGFTPVLFYVATRTDWNQKDEEHLWPRFAHEDPYGRWLDAARTPAEVVEADRFGLGLALRNVQNNPKGYLVSRVSNIPYLFITSFDMFTRVNKSFGQLFRERDLSKLALKLALLLVFSLLPFLLACAGVLGGWRDLTAMMCAGVWVYTFAINFPVWIEYRYGAPAVPFLLVSAAYGAYALTKRFRHRKSPRL